jgi:hypothetical protein
LRGRRLRILGDREVTRFTNWSGIRESNSRLDLGKEILRFRPMQDDSEIKIYLHCGAAR